MSVKKGAGSRSSRLPSTESTESATRGAASESAERTEGSSTSPRGATSAAQTERVTLRRSISRGGNTYGPGEVDVPASLAESIKLAQGVKTEGTE